MPILDVQNLQTSFVTPKGEVCAVDGVSFDINSNETVAIVGESGSGKSVTSLSILRLLATPPAKISGKILFEGIDLLTLSEKRMRKLRGDAVSMIFQEPMTSLNPVFTIGNQICEPLRLHRKMSRGDARKKAREMLETVGIPSAARRLDDYPHEFSGGMRQRVMIAMALACSPKLLIADEPTTALDVTIQAQVLGLMRDLRKEFRSSIMLITHDFGVVAEMADRVVVMYAGRAVEKADVRPLFASPRHPYTAGLLKSMPRMGTSLISASRQPMYEIPGTVPSLGQKIGGCAFAERCKFASPNCARVRPEMRELGPGHFVACHHPLEVAVAEAQA